VQYVHLGAQGGPDVGGQLFQRWPRRDAGSRERDQVERVALGGGVQPPGNGRCDAVTEQRLRLRLGQRPEPHLQGRSRRDGPAEYRGRLTGDLVRPVGGRQHHRAGGGMADQVIDQLGGLRVGPVQVIEHEQHASPRAELLSSNALAAA
jgi:hypothetical protein